MTSARSRSSAGNGWSSFVAAPSNAQLQAFKSATNSAVSGPGTHSIALKTLVAPTSANDTAHLDDHTGIQYQLLGDGIVPDASHPPAAVLDGTYLIQMGLSLAGQPAGSTIQDSDPFYFVMYKGPDMATALADAVAAASAHFPGASIQAIAVPEPGAAGLLVICVSALASRSRGRKGLRHATC